MEQKGNAVVAKSREFSIRVLNVYRCLSSERREFVLSKQLLMSGTSVGTNVKEATRAHSKADFIFKMKVALQEINETEYWLDMLHATSYLSHTEFESMNQDCNELLCLLVSIVKPARKNNS